MELSILIVSLIILSETTLLVFNKLIKPLTSSQKRKVYIDTSVLIDGRILAIAQTGFLNHELIIPRSVIRELQLLADNKDSDKRNRARLGLDIVNELERVICCDVSILPDKLDRTPVDDRLLALAKENRGAVCTLDFNLIKVAAAEKIDTLNINDLAMALRSDRIPGELFEIIITGAGTNQGQGIGHLPDGTMVVVENASNKIGKKISAEVLRYTQTSAGRMLFAKFVTPTRRRSSRSRSHQSQ